MDTLSQINQNQHAYLLRGDAEHIARLLREAIEKKFKVSIDGNPDFHESRLETFGVDEARKLKEDQSRHSFAGEKKFFLISAFSVTHEAQNALLKVFEEPTEGTYIFLIVPSSANILPTLKSRLFDLGGVPLPDGRKGETAEDFLRKNAPERLKSLKKIMEDKDKAAAVSLLNGLEEVLGKKIKENASPEIIFILEELRKGREYLNGRAPSVKMILEHLSLIIPARKDVI